MTEQNPAPINKWKTLDKDLGRIVQLEQALAYANRPMVAVSVGVVFVLVCGLLAILFSGGSSSMMVIVIAAAFGAYMALNIGANDVANNMGPAVGANALTMGGALIIAAVFETMGALIAGGMWFLPFPAGLLRPKRLKTLRSLSGP